MSSAQLPSEHRAQRLLRWYPRRWREQYGEEFAELLVAELDEQTRSWRRTADVARNGLVARLSVLGLAGSPVGGAQAAVGTTAVALVAFLACGLSLWSQLLVGWRWSPLDGRDVRFGVLAMSVAGVYLAGLVLLAAAPLAAAVGHQLRRGTPSRLLLPTAMLVAGTAYLIVGGIHLHAAWPGAGGHSTHLRRLVPGEVAGFAWAETLSLTTYWVHPSTLVTLPGAQIAWILTSPVVLLTTVTSAVMALRRVALSATVLRYETRLARAAAGGMALFLVAAGWWVIGSRGGSNPVFRAGSLDLLLVTTMAAALAVASTAARQLSRN